jgi:hypothetical protein
MAEQEVLEGSARYLLISQENPARIFALLRNSFELNYTRHMLYILYFSILDGKDEILCIMFFSSNFFNASPFFKIWW